MNVSSRDTSEQRPTRLSESLGPVFVAWEGCLAGGVAVVIALVATWPLGQYMLRGLPYGAEAEATVPLLNTWTVWWNADRALEGFQNYWNAPIFYPTQGTFAFSEAQPTTLVVAPLIWLTGSRCVAYNVYLIACLALNGWVAYGWLRSLGATVLAAALSAVLVELLPWTFWQLGVLQLTTLWGPLWTMRAAWQFARTPGLRHAVWLGLAYGTTYAACNYFGLFQTMLLMVAGLALLSPLFLRRSTWAWLLLAAAIAALGAGPIVWKQTSLSRKHTWQRPRETIVDLSAKLRDYTDPPYASRISWGNVAHPERRGGWTLGAGNTLWVAALLGVIVGLVKRGQRRWTLFLLLYGSLAVWLSLGPEARLAGWSTYDTLRSVFPGFGQIRSPFRFCAFAQLAAVLLTTPLWNWLLPRWGTVLQRGESSVFSPPHTKEQPPAFAKEAAAAPAAESTPAPANTAPATVVAATPQRRRRVLTVSRCVVVAVVWCAAVGEVSRPTQRIFVPRPDASLPGWVRMVRVQTSPQTPLAMLPLPYGPDVGDYEQTAEWMYWQTFHGRPLVNGYSGFFPDGFVHLKDELGRFPEGQGIDDLNRSGAEMVVVYEPPDGPINWAQHPAAQASWTELSRDPASGMTLYSISPSSSAAGVSLADPAGRR